MNGKAAPILLVLAALAIAAAVLLTARTPDPTVPDGQNAAPAAGAVPAPGSEETAATSTTQPAEPASPRPATAGAAITPPAAPALAAAGAGAPAGEPAREPRPGQPGQAAEAGKPGNIQAEMAVTKALAAAGLSTADIKIATLGSASAAATDAPAAEAEAATPVRSTRELVVPVPTGAKVPVVFYDQEPRPLPQQQALDRIATEFSDTVNNPPAGYSQQEVWEAARKIADERYTVLYGFDAFNQISMQAAKEALKEKKAASAQTATP